MRKENKKTEKSEEIRDKKRESKTIQERNEK